MEPQLPASSEPQGPSVTVVAGSVVLITLAVGLVLGAIAFDWHQREQYNEQLLYEKEGAHLLELQSAIITRKFDAIRSDLLFLSEQAILKSYTTRASPGKAELRQEYHLFAEKKQIYDQVRYIDEVGRESVRIDLYDGRPVALDDDRLQDKSERYYFERARKLQRGEIYVSPLDLNVEHGRIEAPLKPVIRFSTPVFDESGQHRGIVVLNYLGQKLIEELIDVSSNVPGSVALLDSKGYWLHGSTTDDEWGFMFGNESTYGLRHPGAWERISSRRRGRFENQDGLTTFATVAYPTEGPIPGSCTLRLVHTVPRRDLYARSDQLLVWLLWGYWAVVALTAASAWFLIWDAALRRHQELQIRASEGRLRLLSSRLLNVQEEERAHLSRDLHDDLGQLATSAILQLRMARRLQGEECTNKIEQAIEAVEQMLHSSRELATRLRPPMLNELGLKATVETYLSEFETRSEIVVHADLQLPPPELPTVIGQNLYRILQEALTNVFKHAAVAEVYVRLVVREQTVTLTVSDRGTGFRPEVVPSSGLGILGMRERVELLGGRLEVVSRPGGGTEIRADLPLEAS